MTKKQDLSLQEFPTIEGSNSKQELGFLKNLLHSSTDDEEENEKSVSSSECNRSKLQDFYFVLVALGLSILFLNPYSLKLLTYATGNAILGYILGLIVFGGILYLIYIFMP